MHAIGSLAEKKVTQQFVADFRKVEGKNALIGQLAGALAANPDGVVKEVALPVVSNETLWHMAVAYKACHTYQPEVLLRMRSSYSHHYHRMVPLILQVLGFHSNNNVHRPLV